MSNRVASLLPPPDEKILRLLPAVGADKAAHVFCDAGNRKTELLAEGNGFFHIDGRYLLGRGDDDGAASSLVEKLRHREWLIAGTRRRVDDQVVEISPGDITEELAYDVRLHRVPAR